MSDLINRADAIVAVRSYFKDRLGKSKCDYDEELQVYVLGKEERTMLTYNKGINDKLRSLPSADAVQGEWIPCGEKMPKELERVNVTWLNHNPPFYYQHIKDIPQTDTAVYYRGKWYWWDATVIDLLGEYDGAYIHGIEPIDKDIEVVAWMPLPTPYKGGDTE